MADASRIGLGCGTHPPRSFSTAAFTDGSLFTAGFTVFDFAAFFFAIVLSLPRRRFGVTQSEPPIRPDSLPIRFRSRQRPAATEYSPDGPSTVIQLAALPETRKPRTSRGSEHDCESSAKSAEGGSRTHTPSKGYGILNPARLPFRHFGIEGGDILGMSSCDASKPLQCETANVTAIFSIGSPLVYCSTKPANRSASS